MHEFKFTTTHVGEQPESCKPSTETGFLVVVFLYHTQTDPDVLVLFVVFHYAAQLRLLLPWTLSRCKKRYEHYVQLA